MINFEVRANNCELLKLIKNVEPYTVTFYEDFISVQADYSDEKEIYLLNNDFSMVKAYIKDKTIFYVYIKDHILSLVEVCLTKQIKEEKK